MARRHPPIDRPASGGNAPDPPPLFPANFESLKSYTDWRPTWTHIVAGRFSRNLHWTDELGFTQGGFDDLLFYDQSNGYAEFYTVPAAGEISLVQAHSDWRAAWRDAV